MERTTLSSEVPRDTEETTGAIGMHVETVDELAERWRVSRSRIYLLIDEGLPSRKIGRSRRFITSEVDAWLLGRTA